MIVSTIKQFGLRLRADPEEIPFQHSANVQMQFIKDENYNDYTVVGYYIPPGENEAKLLSINDDGKFILGPDCFKQRGTLSFSFNLINSQEEVHLGSIDFEIRYAFGDSDTILPEPEEVWISLVTKVAEDAIKEDVELVKQKAKEASQSALTASEKANEALEYANNANQSADSASLSASSALTAKTDAIAASNSAIQAKQDAEQSANNAKNSADTALANANKSNEAIKTVTQIKTEIENKANDFDTNYQEKLKSFNDNATSKQNAFDNSVQTANTNLDNKVNQANSDLNAKVQEANTIIDEKVKTATEQAQKATDEANRAEQATDGKLDKNLGSENSDKVLITDAEGNVITQSKEDFEGGGTSDYNDLENKPQINGVELKGNKTSGDLKMYTQEEVDYMLADKMDKPYVSIEITDSATIDDALAGNFKIDKIKGNTYQKVETNIVPTPSRPVPINSRKVKVGDEYVELRSLKESVNKFDLGLLSQTYLIPQTGSYRKIEIPTKLKPGVRYTFYYENFMTPALSWLVLNIINSTGNIIFSAFNVDNKNNEEIKVNGRSIAFNAPSSGEIYFDYYVQSYDAEGNLVPQSTEMFKENWFTKYVKNIMITEESLNQTTYIAPTVRDYKIVDHTTQTSKIVRNVGIANLTNLTWRYGDRDLNHIRCYALPPSPLKYVKEYCYCNVFECNYDSPYNYSKEAIYLGNSVGGTTIAIMANADVFADETQEQFDRLLKEYINNPNAEALYALKTPTEEEIAYSADDVSEVGYSWQDTTSPSLDIKSEIYQVDKIDIKSVGKNFIDINYISNIENWTNSNTDGYYYIPIAVPKNAQLVISNDVKVPAGRGYFANFSPYKEKNAENYYFIYHNDIGSALGKFTSITKSNVVYLRLNSINVNLPSFVEDFKKMQLEIGSVATPYEPYQEISIQHTLSKPLRATKDGSVRDAIDIVNMQTTYNITDFTVDGNTTIALGTDKEKTRVIQINNQPFLNPTNNLKMYCDKLLNDSGKDEELFTVSTALFIAINKNRVEANDINAFKKWFGENPLYFIGISKTPTTEPLEDELVEKLKTLKTFSSVTHVFVEGVAKPKLNARYPKDIAAAQAQLEAKVITLQEAVIKNV
ncbi:MAG: hypothetical protein ACLSAL_06290 [Thomasclavelia spiroformis]|uniref:hypothetical protein n=1 Tax=Thomasclavelia spiroformis TaxID=29348 RepID=UPI0039A08AD4